MVNIYRMGGKVWIKQMLMSAFFLPFVVCGTAFFINFIAIYYHASRAIPFGTMVSYHCCNFTLLLNTYTPLPGCCDLYLHICHPAPHPGWNSSGQESSRQPWLSMQVGLHFMTFFYWMIDHYCFAEWMLFQGLSLRRSGTWSLGSLWPWEESCHLAQFSLRCTSYSLPSGLTKFTMSMASCCLVWTILVWLFKWVFINSSVPDPADSDSVCDHCLHLLPTQCWGLQVIEEIIRTSWDTSFLMGCKAYVKKLPH